MNELELSFGAACCLCLLLCGAGSGAAQEPAERPPIRVQTALVSVPVIVSDGQGRYIAGLGADDFVLYQDGERQPIALFTSSEEPIHVVLMLDTSKSTILVLDEIKEAAAEFLHQLRPQDRAMVVSFDSSIRLLSPLGSSRVQLDRAIRSAEVDQGNYTRLRDALQEVLAHHLRPVQGRKAVVILSDGLDFGSFTPVGELFSAVGESDAVIYSVYYEMDPRELMKKLFGVSSRVSRRRARPAAAADTAAPPDPQTVRDFEREGAEILKRLAEESAGRFYGGDWKNLKRTFARLLLELRQQYLLGFYPDSSKLDGRRHGLRIEVLPRDAVVRSRRGYSAGGVLVPVPDI